jgi:hypothetical protein
MNKTKTQTGARAIAARKTTIRNWPVVGIVDHPHAANRLAVVLQGEFVMNEHGAVVSFRTREDAQKWIDSRD